MGQRDVKVGQTVLVTSRLPMTRTAAKSSEGDGVCPQLSFAVSLSPRFLV